MMNADTHHPHGHRHAGRAEYALYFSLILLISVPTALIRSLLPNRSAQSAKMGVSRAGRST